MSERSFRTPEGDSALTYKIVSSIRDVNVHDWNAVTQTPDETMFMDVRFLETVETSMHDACKLWHVVFYDRTNTPVACVSLCSLPVDLLIFAGPKWKHAGTAVRRLWPTFAFVNVFFCGLPVSVGQSAVRIVPGVDHKPILRQLEVIIRTLARKEHARFIVYKEFTPRDTEQMDYLSRLGYRRADSLPMHFFNPQFANFTEYYSALKCDYRKNIRRSQRKFQNAGLRVEVVKDTNRIRELHTAELHKLYLAVVMNSDYKLEILPPEFFHELARRFQDQMSYVVIWKDDRIVAFSSALYTRKTYYALFCGLDYSLNHDYDLYFNLIYSDLDNALKQRVSAIQVGQTADMFKKRLGCFHEALYLYAKGAGPVSAPLMNLFFNVIFPPQDGSDDQRMTPLRQGGPLDPTGH